ncbi:hypothetical protein CDL15_Pgr000715 [Punica granatum]|uniref:Uncharacterized protein n=1 Tax=Punica granatum TaxID=22663 RepID=A0A218W3Y7_PUNGR|nr:hypothetical protein CDL15_Pgr000715 [Punica granatum]PKI31628.1 hypothetical protein CRG98_048010 [Punica granatum]
MDRRLLELLVLARSVESTHQKINIHEHHMPKVKGLQIDRGREKERIDDTRNGGYLDRTNSWDGRGCHGGSRHFMTSVIDIVGAGGSGRFNGRGPRFGASHVDMLDWELASKASWGYHQYTTHCHPNQITPVSLAADYHTWSSQMSTVE